MFKKIQKNLIISIVLFLGLAGFSFAQTCPANTIVTGTTVNFVGELTDMGGDSTTNVWFEYGRTTSYGQTTAQRVLTQTGFYCISVSGLLPNTTYHYRAVAQNSADVSYGQDKSFTTTAITYDPTVNIKANNSNGPITIPYDSSVNLTWTSADADYCYASGAW
ncbi:MAG: hypothetical protein PHN37_02520, partial [Candidatus Pacebacteria bacterium]|nr:hypothetical protein [Candidatus Paceibacterota bacterium]